MNDNHESHLKYEGRLRKWKRENYFRLDLKLERLPKMNDEKEMENLRRAVREHGATERRNLKNALLMASFFFELDHRPILGHEPILGHRLYHCQGSIRCRVTPLPVINALQVDRGNELEFVLDKGVHQEVSLVRLRTTDALDVARDIRSYICKQCDRLKIPVDFYVRHPTETISIVCKTDETRRRISGFPHSMAWFVSQQQLDAAFGCQDHVLPAAATCPACSAQNLKRRSTFERLNRSVRPRKISRQT